MDRLTRIFSRNLRHLRIAQRVSQDALARRAAITSSYVSMLERGQRSPPFATLTRLAKALKVTEAYLIQELDVGHRRRVARRSGR